MRNQERSTPAGKYFQEHGISLNKLPKDAQYIMRKLSERPTKVAPNSPKLPVVAQLVNIPLAQLQEWAEAPPMGDRWVQKIAGQMQRGTIYKGGNNRKGAKRAKRRDDVDMIPDGGYKPIVRRVHRTRTHRIKTHPSAYGPQTPFAKMVQANGRTLNDLARSIGVPKQMIWTLSRGDMAENHPLLSVVAKELGVPTDRLARLMNRKPLEGKRLTLALRRMTQILKGERQVSSNGRSLVPVAKLKPPVVREMPSSYNKLRKQDFNLRSAVRGVVSTVNMALMAGEETTPPLPMPLMHALLKDYLERLGLREDLLVSPDFSEAFDPRK